MKPKKREDELKEIICVLEERNFMLEQQLNSLPSEEEILKIMLRHTCNSELTCTKIAKVIHKRMRGEK